MRKVVFVLLLALGASHLSYGLEDCEKHRKKYLEFIELSDGADEKACGLGWGAAIGGVFGGPFGAGVGAFIGLVAFNEGSRPSRREYKKIASDAWEDYKKCLARNKKEAEENGKLFFQKQKEKFGIGK